MHECHTTDAGRIEREASPSCGYNGVMELCHAPHGNAVEPVAETDDDAEEIDVSAMRVSDDTDADPRADHADAPADAVDGQTAHREATA